MIILLLALIATSTAAARQAKIDTAYTVERNHFYDDQAELLFVQLIFWEKCWQGQRCFAWRIIDEPYPIPQRCKRGYLLTFRDAKSKRLRRVRFSIWRVTHTQYDRELWDRKAYPVHLRRGLR